MESFGSIGYRNELCFSAGRTNGWNMLDGAETKSYWSWSVESGAPALVRRKELKKGKLVKLCRLFVTVDVWKHKFAACA